MTVYPVYPQQCVLENGQGLPSSPPPFSFKDFKVSSAFGGKQLCTAIYSTTSLNPGPQLFQVYSLTRPADPINL